VSRRLTIGELEAVSGLKRTTIYFYTRQRIVPPAHKAGRGRGIYGERHVRTLAEVARLKAEGFSLDEIRRRVDEFLGGLPPEEVDLVAEQRAETRSTILETALRYFVRHGFRATRVMDIIQELGMPPLIFYRYFPTKRQLFLDTVDMFAELMVEHIEPALAGEEDFVRREMLRAHGFLGIYSTFPDMLTFIKAEAMSHKNESEIALRRTYQGLLQPAVTDLANLMRRAGRPSTHYAEMTAYALMGVLEGTAMRLSWDRKYSVADYYWVNLQATLAIVDRYGLQEKRQDGTDYSSFIDELVTAGPPMPPRLASAVRPEKQGPASILATLDRQGSR
jgi:AcrR family transcriptional regulator